MAYLDRLVFQNGNLTVSGFNKEGAIVPSMGIDTFIAFKVDNLTNAETLLSINKINFPLEFISSSFRSTNGTNGVTLSIYPDILTNVMISQLNIGANIYTFPSKTIVLPTHRVTIRSTTTNAIAKLIIYAKPVDVYEVSNDG